MGSFKFNFIISNVWCQIVLVPNFPVPNCPGAKLSWCQIVHFYYLSAKLSAFIILVPNCPLYYLGAKLSGAKLSWCQIVLVPNCPLLLSWCQIVRFYYLGAKLSPLLSWCQIVRCQIVRCQIVRCQIVLQSKSGTIFFISNIYIPKMKNKKKRRSF